MIKVLHLPKGRHTDFQMLDEVDSALYVRNNLKLYKLVATVDTDDLGTAFHATSNDNWPRNDKVTCNIPRFNPPLTKAGDVLEKDGTFYLVELFGFVKI